MESCQWVGQEAYWKELRDDMHRHDFVWSMAVSHENLIYSNIYVVTQYKDWTD